MGAIATSAARSPGATRRTPWWIAALVLTAACGRYRFDERIDGSVEADACAPGEPGCPLACEHQVCRPGEVACPGGECSNGLCVGSAAAPITEASAGDRALFGAAVDTDGQRIVVGAPNARAAYVLEPSGASWTVVATLTSAWGPPNSGFGGAVAIEGDRIVVGARYSGGAGITDSIGAIVIYERSPAGPWTEVAQQLGAVPNGEFGGAVDLDGGRILVGAEFADEAYILEGSGASWSTVATLADGPVAYRHGHHVQLRGDRAFAGSIWDDAPSMLAIGAIRVWERQPDAAWTLAAKLQVDDPRIGGGFGQNFSVDGDTVVAGVPYFTEAGLLDVGAIYVFTRDPAGAWQPQGPILPTVQRADRAFGRGVWVSGDLLFATAVDRETAVSVTTSIYRRQCDGTWREVGARIDATGPFADHVLGGIQVDMRMTGIGERAILGIPTRTVLGIDRVGGISVHDATGL